MTRMTIRPWWAGVTLSGWLVSMAMVGAVQQPDIQLVLASAQVVTPVERPPLLRLAANAPLAFETRPSEDGDAGGASLVVYLPGVVRADLATLGPLLPFGVTAVHVEGGMEVTVSAAGVAGLEARAGRQPNEIDIVASSPVP